MDRLIEFLGNHAVLTAALIAVLIAIAVNEIFRLMRGGRRVSPQEAVRLINDQNALVVDLRPAAEFKRGHILGAMNAPYANLGEHLAKLKKAGDRPLLLCCGLGSVSVQAGLRLRKEGLEQICALTGGLNAWQGAGLPVTTK